MIALAVYLYAAVYAWVEATDDAAAIDAGEPIHHGWRFWLIRALRFIVPVSLVYVLWWASYEIPDMEALWSLSLSLVGGGAVFATCHRYILNWHRHLPPTYTSNSNGYDRAWRKVLGAHAGLAMYITEITLTLTSYLLHP
jgi:hypothetical protein